MESLGTLYVRLAALTGEFVDSFDGAASKVKEFTDKLKNVSDPIASTAAALTAVGTAALAAASSVDDGARAAFLELRRASELLSNNIAYTLRPAIAEVSRILREMAGFIGGLNPAIKANIAHWGVMAVKIGLAAKAFSMLMSLLGGTMMAMRAIAAVMSGTLVISIAAVSAAIITLHGAWRTNWQDIQEKTVTAVNAIKKVFVELALGIYKVLTYPLVGLMKILENLVGMFAKLAKAIPPQLDKYGIRNMSDILSGVMTEIRKDLESGAWINSGLDFAKELAKGLGKKAVTEIGIMKDAVAKAFGLDKPISTGSAIQPTQAPSRKDSLERIYSVTRAEHERAAAEFETMATVKKSLLMIGQDWWSVGELSQRETEQLKKSMMSRWKSLEQDFGKVMKEMSDAGATFGQKFKVWIARVGKTTFTNFALSKTGALGETVQAVTEGAKAGGFWGALIAMVMQVVTRMKSFKELLDIFEKGLSRLGEFFETGLGAIFDVIGNLTAVGTEMIGDLIEALSPIFNIIASALNDLGPFLAFLGHIFKALAPIIKMFADLLKTFSEVLKPVVKIIFQVIVYIVSGVIQVISFIFAKIVQVVAWVVGLFDKNAAAAIRVTAKELEASAAAMEELRNMSWDDYQAEADATAAKWREKEATDDLTKTLIKVNEAFSNVPEGYRLALARYRAMADGAGGGSAPSYNMVDMSKVNRPVVIYGGVTVNPAPGYTTYDFVRDVAADASRQNGVATQYPLIPAGGSRRYF